MEGLWLLTTEFAASNSNIFILLERKCKNSAHQLKPANLFLWNWKADKKAFGKYIGPLEYRNR
jgi:hypothetical protein